MASDQSPNEPGSPDDAAARLLRRDRDLRADAAEACETAASVCERARQTIAIATDLRRVIAEDRYRLLRRLDQAVPPQLLIRVR